MSEQSSPSSTPEPPAAPPGANSAMQALIAIAQAPEGAKPTIDEIKATVANLQAAAAQATAPVPATVSSVAPVPVTARVRYRRELGRLLGIVIDNYRAFRGRFELQLPKGENALIYGENGAGKSSLFHSLSDFLEAPHRDFLERTKPDQAAKRRELRVADHAHRPSAGHPRIELTFERGRFAWDTAIEKDGKRSEQASPWNILISAADKVKGFLDYRALLRVHYLDGEVGQRIDVFQLMLKHLLPHFTYFHSGSWWDLRRGATSGSGERTFAQGWADLERRKNSRMSAKDYEQFQAARAAFDQALKVQVEQHLAARSSELARRFDPALEIEFTVTPSRYTTSPRKTLEPPKVYVHPRSGGMQVLDYDRFFNEARLTAIALSVFFAALLESPAKRPGLLALDDILIGLDMANRLTVLRIVEEYFREWQVLIFTYHKAWFEILKERTVSKIWRFGWKSVVLRQERVRSTDFSVVRSDESRPMLETADRYAARGEYKSAAVHARTAMELILRRFCARKKLPVCFVQDSNKQTNHHFLSAIHLWLSRLRSPSRFALWEELFAELKHSLRFVLHSYSHNSSEREDELEGEVVAAIKIVRRLDEFLKSVRERELAHDVVPAKHRTFEWLIEDAVTTSLSARPDEALRSLAHATESFLRSELLDRGVVVRLLENEDVWKWLFQKGKPTKEERNALVAKRPYLGGGISKEDFEEAAFNEAAKFLLQMRALRILRKRKPAP